MDGNVRIEELEQHLLFHKALADDEESLRRLGGYMDILSRAESGERLQDPVDESIRAVFSLVLENGMDPWEIDLSQFVRMYEAKVSSDSFDMIVAGKLLLMAWRILRMQSESTRERSEPPAEPVFEEVDDSFFYDDEPMYVPEVSFREAYQREPVRPGRRSRSRGRGSAYARSSRRRSRRPSRTRRTRRTTSRTSRPCGRGSRSSAQGRSASATSTRAAWTRT